MNTNKNTNLDQACELPSDELTHVTGGYQASADPLLAAPTLPYVDPSFPSITPQQPSDVPPAPAKPVICDPFPGWTPMSQA